MLPFTRISSPSTPYHYPDHELPFHLSSNDPFFFQADPLAQRVLFHVSFFFHSYFHSESDLVRIYPLGIESGRVHFIAVKKSDMYVDLPGEVQCYTLQIDHLLAKHNDHLSPLDGFRCRQIHIDFLRADILPIPQHSEKTTQVLMDLSRMDPCNLLEMTPLEALIFSLTNEIKPKPEFWNFLCTGPFTTETAVEVVVKHLATAFCSLLKRKKQDQKISEHFLNGHLSSPLVVTLRDESLTLLRQILPKSIELSVKVNPLAQEQLTNFIEMMFRFAQNSSVEISSLDQLKTFHLILGLELAFRVIASPDVHCQSKVLRSLKFALEMLRFSSGYLSSLAQVSLASYKNTSFAQTWLFNVAREKKQELLSLGLSPELETLYLFYIDTLSLSVETGHLATQYLRNFAEQPTHTLSHNQALGWGITHLATNTKEEAVTLKIDPSIWTSSPYWLNLLQIKKVASEFFAHALTVVPTDLRKTMQTPTQAATFKKVDRAWLVGFLDLMESNYKTQYEIITDCLAFPGWENDEELYIPKKRRTYVERLRETQKLFPSSYFQLYSLATHTSCGLTSNELQKFISALTKIFALSAVYENHQNSQLYQICDLGLKCLLDRQIKLYNQLAGKAGLPSLNKETLLARTTYSSIAVTSPSNALSFLPFFIATEQLTAETLLSNFENSYLHQLEENFSKFCELDSEQRRIAMTANEFDLITKYTQNARFMKSKEAEIMKKFARFAYEIFNYLDRELKQIPTEQKCSLVELLDAPSDSTRHMDEIQSIWGNIFTIQLSLLSQDSNPTASQASMTSSSPANSTDDETDTK